MVIIKNNRTKKYKGGFISIDAVLSFANIDYDLKQIIKAIVVQIPLKDKVSLSYNIINAYRNIDPNLLSNLDSLPIDFVREMKNALKQTVQSRINGEYNIFSVETIQLLQNNLKTFIQDYTQTHGIKDEAIQSVLSIIEIFKNALMKFMEKFDFSQLESMEQIKNQIPPEFAQHSSSSTSTGASYNYLDDAWGQIKSSFKKIRNGNETKWFGGADAPAINPEQNAVLNKVDAVAPKGIPKIPISGFDKIIFTYIEDVSEILCEHGIDFDKYLDITHKDLATRGVFLDILMAKMADDIKIIVDKSGFGFLMPIDVSKIAGGIFAQLKEKGSFKCSLRNKTPDQIVNLNPPDIEKRENNVKSLLGLEKTASIMDTLSGTLSGLLTTEKPKPKPEAGADAQQIKTSGGKRIKKTRRRSNK